MAQPTINKGRKTADVHKDYEGFVDKFKPKLTTDDCITPPEMYELIKRWVNDNITPLEGRRILRPFWPGADYTAVDYREGDIVLDNPPFSCLSKIIDYYMARGVQFFLFAPHLTLFGYGARPGVTCICAQAKIVYENGAEVPTGFVTNMEGRHRVIVAGDLYKAVEAMKKEEAAKKNVMPKYAYPGEVTTAALLGTTVVRGICFKVPFEECEHVRKLDNQTNGKVLFGSGFLLSEKAAAEKAAAEKAAAEKAAAEKAAAEKAAAREIIRWELSEREQAIVARLSGKSEDNPNLFTIYPPQKTTTKQ